MIRNFDAYNHTDRRHNVDPAQFRQIVLDAIMPGDNGSEAAKLIKPDLPPFAGDAICLREVSLTN